MSAWTAFAIPANAQQPTAAALATAQRRLERLLPASFTVVVRAPFLVVGNEPPTLVQRRADGTVGWALERLRAEYSFTRAPRRILTIWLLRDAASYRSVATKLTGEAPDTPYGFYSPSAAALIMNISTGGGTLVHELVHPLIEANFPACPAWFNEGLGSLYEQSSERGGRIIGLPNWRLPGLQRALRRNRVRSFAALLALSDAEFYRDESGLNYAQARYLLLYLQELGLLQRYYQRYRASAASDPTGYRTLLALLGAHDLRGFRQRWEQFVLGLRFG